MCTNYVKCHFCNRIDKYDTKLLGTNTLNAHAEKCNTTLRTIDSYVQHKNPVITTEDKKTLTKAAALFCYNDMHPFNAIQGDGFIKFMSVYSGVVAKYGKLDEKKVQSFLQ